tara:strand:- start:1252 stop:2157 length:906 start_codon:yes stop_codon:yes gene_type:complete
MPARKKITQQSQPTKKPSKIKTIKKRNISLPNKIKLNLKTDFTVEQLLSDDILPILQSIYPGVSDDILINFSKIKYDAPNLRSITQDFVSIIRSDETNIGSKISYDCNKNYKNFGSICYCCGKRVNIKTSDKQCDHLIPIINMMLYIKPSETTSSGKLKNLLSNNLHYIHSRCNSKKSNCSLQELWDKCGTPFYTNNKILGGISSVNSTSEDYERIPLSIYKQTLNPGFNKQYYHKLLCREKIARILRNIAIHKDIDIEQRINALAILNNKIKDLKENAKLYLSNTNAAQLLIDIHNMEIN